MAVNMFILFLNMSISGALAAALLIVWRYVSYKYIPSKFYYVLWLVLMFRFVVPFNIKSIFSVLNLFEKADSYSFGNRYIVTMEYIDHANLINAGSVTAQSFLKVVSAVWLIVAVVFICQWLRVIISAEKHLEYAVLYKDDIVTRIKADVDIKRSIKVFTSTNIVSPVVAGFWKPRIILPESEALSDEEIKYTIAHEMVHIKRYDHILKSLFYFVAALHWYNPMVWLSFWLFNEDIETSCDRQVLGIYGAEHKSRYANVLFEHAKRKNSFRLGYMSFARDKVTARIEKVLKYRQLSVQDVALFTVTTLLIGLCSTTNPVFAADYQYIPKTVYVNSTVRNDVEQFITAFAGDIEANNVAGIINKSTADAGYLAHTYAGFENSHVVLNVEKIFYTSQTTADVYLNLTENDGTLFPQDTDRIVAQIDSSKAMNGLYAKNLHSYEKYNSINKINYSDEAVMLVEKMIKFGLTDGSNTPENAEKIAAFCMDIACDRSKDKSIKQIPYKQVEDIAKEFFLFDDFSNLRNTDYYSNTQNTYIYNKSIGTHYEYAITAFEKNSDKAVVTVEFYKDPLQTQVEKTVKYTLKKV